VPGLPRSRPPGLTSDDPGKSPTGEPAGDLESTNGSPRPWILAAAVAVLAAAIFAPSISGDFIYDDRRLIAGNVYVHSFDAWRRWFTHDFWDVNEEVKHFGERMIYWRPGVTASYAIDWQLGHGSPFVFHTTNLLCHAITSCLAFLTLRRWLGVSMPAFLAALVFAVHPTKAESVAWIAGRTDVLCAAAMLLASTGFARRLAGQRGGLALESIGTVLAYSMKEQALTLFAFVAVETWVALGRPAVDGTALRRMARAATPQLLLAVAYSIGRAILMPIKQPHAASFGALAHTKEVFETMGRYAALTFVPHDLSVQQGLMREPGGRIAFDLGYVALGAAFVVVLVWAAVATRKRVPGVTVGMAFFGFTIFPTSNVVTTDMITMLSERFLYVPLLGLVLAGASLALSATRIGERPRLALAAAAGAIVLAFSVVAARRAADFQDEEQFWARELALHPESLEALRFAIQTETDQKHLAKALDLVARGRTLAAMDYPQTGGELDFIVQGVELALMATPDHDASSLRSIDDFLRTVSMGGHSVAELELRLLRIRISLASAAVAKRVDKLRPRVLALRAAIESRVADDGGAIELAETAHLRCPGCLDVGRVAALISARAGRYERGQRILDTVASFAGEPAVVATRALLRSAQDAGAAAATSTEEAVKLHLRATELCTLEAWGRAFDVLATARTEIEQAPAFALGFAELAWRAGEFKVAQEVLANLMPSDAAETTTRGWSAKMGWIEAERADTGDRRIRYQ